MRKTMQDLATYLKSIVLPEIDELDSIKSIFEDISTKDQTQEGVIAYRDFLCHLYDRLIIEGDRYDHHTKVAHEYENRTTLSVYYPFLQHVKTLLMKIGFHGVLTEDNQYLICDDRIFNEKISTSKNIECLRFLIDCGIKIEGLNLYDRKPDLSNINSIKISYPQTPIMVVGLKVMALAEVELGTLDNQDIFLRCDYRVLENNKAETITLIKDAIRTLPKNTQDFVLQLHQRYLDKGMKCVVETKGFWIYIKYVYKRKDLWGINASLNNGFHINVKAQNMHQYPEAIEKFPLFMQEVITKGYGCGRKIASIGHCNGGCRGMIIPLDNTALEMKDEIELWLDKEMEFI